MAGPRKKVVILGGGIGGLSAAHELSERGFEVEVFERKAIPGGKARSIAADEGSLGTSPFGARPLKRPLGPPGRPLPGEHGFRFFPGFYKHVVDTMARIPFGGGSVADNLVDTTELRISPFDGASFDLPAQFPRATDDLRTDLFAIISVISGRAGIEMGDGLFFATKLWEFLTSCEERRLVEYERINWWDYIEAGARSSAYQKYFGNGITRSLVAAKARRASTKTIGDIFVQILLNILLPGVAADRVLNGPTNDVWINPWLEHLERQGVHYHLDADVRAIHCERGIVRGATVAIGNSLHQVTGDYFIGALPVERMAELISPAIIEADASLANLHALVEYVEWMNGIQFYLTEDVPITKGHVICVDSPWAITLVSQPQFWGGFDLTTYGDGSIRGLLSVDLSDWDVEGLNGKEARHCSRDEIARETWAQLKRSLNGGGDILRDDQLHSWFLDPDILDLDIDGDQTTPRDETNAEPLLVNYVDTWRLRPEAVTRIPNFFLASDYVRTYTDLATMEAANEAARRAVNGVIHAAGADIELCQVWNLHEPEALSPFRAHDRVRYRKGLPWDGQAMSVIGSALGLTSGLARAPALAGAGGPFRELEESVRQILRTSPALAGAVPGPLPAPAVGPSRAANSADAAEEVASEARASSDEGLRRLRIRSGP
jgi:uncharacterized protein with NAD-binding domain and iron-sulfur cluster